MVRWKAASSRLGFRSTGQQLGRSLRHGGHVSPPEWAAPPIRAKGQSRGKEARRKEVSRERPTIVTAIAALFLLSAVYLLIVGLAMLARPGLVSMAAGADLLSTGDCRPVHVPAGECCWNFGRGRIAPASELGAANCDSARPAWHRTSGPQSFGRRGCCSHLGLGVEWVRNHRSRGNRLQPLPSTGERDI